jgi:DNA modification methylase/transcriptional regulator with XRE-family HTH domain
MAFGPFLKKLRAVKGLSLRELAAKCDVDAAYLSRVERGKAPPSQHLLSSLATELDCPHEELTLMAGRLTAGMQALVERQPGKIVAGIRQLASTLQEPATDYISAPPTNGARAKRRKKPVVSDAQHSLLGPGESPDGGRARVGSEVTQSEEPPATVDPRNKLNALSAREWIPETISVWTQRGLGAGHADAQIERQHPAPFSFTDVSRLVRFFSKPGETVLDPFVGVGSTLKACALEGRAGIGIELNPRYAGLAKKRLETEVGQLLHPAVSQQVLVGDARAVAKGLATGSVQFVVTSPPYWNILHKEDHKAKQERRHHDLDTRYGDDPRDLGNVKHYPEFLAELTGILSECGRVLAPRRYMALVVSDFRDKSKFIMFHADLAADLAKHKLALRGVKVLYQRHKKVFPYGYPFAYVPNIHHQYILILQNER